MSVFRFFLIVALLSTTACKPKTYEDCVLEQMQNGNSDTAARIISKACEVKYGLPAYKQREKEASLNAPAAEAAPANNENGEKVIGLLSEMGDINANPSQKKNTISEQKPKLISLMGKDGTDWLNQDGMPKKEPVEQAIEVQRTVQDAINSVPKLAHIQATNPKLFAMAVEIDSELKNDPAFANLTLTQRFEKVVERLENKAVSNELNQ